VLDKMTEDRIIIRGSKKGGGPREPIEAPDTLSSTQFARVLDLISEGEIDQFEDVFLDKTSLTNFSGYVREFRVGTQNQSPILIEGGTLESTTSVGVTVTQSGGPITRTVTNTDIDRVAITVQVPTLQIIESDGDIVGHSVSFQISLQFNGGGYNVVASPTIKGKTSNPYSKTYNVSLAGASFPVDIRLTRTSADETSAKRQNTLNWTSFTSIIDEVLRYPNSAIHFLEFDAQNFNNIPERRFLIRGIKVQIPHNASVDTTTHIGRITYSGLFNGTLGAATWTNDPAWCLYDLLKNTRYGCSIPDAHLDKFDFFAISQYCNELVSNGKGGQEPRFSLNCVLNTRKEVFTVIKELTNVFRGLAYFTAGSFVVKQDKPTDSTYVINPSMVVDGFFEYNGTSLKSRHTCVTVAYQSYDMIGDVLFERVEDADAVRVYGVNHKEVRSIGCYSQGQAQRLGRWILETERYLTQTVSFTVSQDAGVVLSPAMVVSVADPLKTVSRRGGRIHAATINSITVDSTEDIGTITLGQNPKISVVLGNGLLQQKTVSAISSPTTASGGEDTTRKTFTVSSNFSQVPSVGGFYGIDTDTIALEKFRILRVTEEEDHTHSVTAIQYDESIYARVDTPIVTTPTPNPIGAAPDAVTDISFTTFYYVSGASVLIGCDISWTHNGLRTVQYFVEYRIDNDNFQQIITTSPNATLKSLRVGTLEVRVTAFNFLGGRSPVYSETHAITQNTNPPDNVQSLTINQISPTQAVLNWPASTSRDVLTGGKVVIRHSTNTSATFATAASLLTVSGSSTSANVSAITGKYFAVFENILGVQSTTPASVLFTASAGNQTLIIDRKEDTDSPTFQGTFTDVEKYSPPNYPTPLTGIVLKGNILWDSVSDVDALTTWDFPNNVLSTGTYEFANVLDLEDTYNVLLERRLAFTGFNVSTGAAVTDIDAKIFVSTTNDDPSSGSATFTAFQEFATTMLNARGFKFKVVLSSSNVTSNVCVTELGFRMFMSPSTQFPQIQIPSGTSTKAVTFLHKFFTGVSATIGGVGGFTPIVNANILNIQTGDTIAISSITKSGFNADVKDSGGNFVNRNFVYQATGLR
jgi:predicted phage tail protein